MRIHNPRTGAGKSRNAAALVLALILLFVTSAICASLARGVVLRQQQLEPRWQGAQAELLADAAIERAVAKLQSDPDYTLETWTPVAGDVPIGTANIAVESLGTEQYRVQVKVFVPEESTSHRAQRTLQRTISLKK